MSTLTYPLADSATMLRRNLVHAKRYPSMTFSLIVMPIILLLVFNYVFGGALGIAVGGSDSAYIDYLTPGMMLLIPAYVTVGVAVSIATDATKGIVNRFRTMAITQSSILAGHVIGTLIQALLGVAAMVGVALLIGFRPTATAVEWAAAFGLIALLVIALTWLAVAMGLLAANPESASNMPFPLVMLPFLGSGLVPTETMPAGMRHFAEHQPFTPLTETLRGLLMGTEIGSSGPIALAWCLGIGVVGYFWSMAIFRRQTR
ncbi:ABC transporter permease [Hoyosella subflava]|uniref:Transport permease protein n=1 Tax=Hoyosella subflava (strain DSM 45089 / JCM 17490 / NBRC 109087 / DQS3-9A1) TaxID=443218 RepID=F6ELZ8_HOYSD|nr:ABC transporter permease [Hoyosella subflava]AEF42779.1 ABC transporter permease protein [Hoyosella subflava DQS3-9A1]